jgi:hypothetical protein
MKMKARTKRWDGWLRVRNIDMELLEISNAERIGKDWSSLPAQPAHRWEDRQHCRRAFSDTFSLYSSYVVPLLEKTGFIIWNTSVACSTFSNVNLTYFVKQLEFFILNIFFFLIRKIVSSFVRLYSCTSNKKN